MDDQGPTASLNAFVETRADLEPVGQDSVVQIQLPSSSSGTFSRASRSQRRVVTSTAVCRGEETYSRSCLADTGSIYFSKSRRYPRSFLWRVLDNSKVLDLRSVDLSKRDRDQKEAAIVLQFGFANAVRKGCVALEDDGDGVLSVFVLTKSNELFTLTIPTICFCDAVASEESTERWSTAFSHSTISLCTPQRLIAASPLQLVVTSDDGGIIRLNRCSDQDASAWEVLVCTESKWGSSLRGLVRWQGNNSVKYNGKVLDPNTAVAAEFSPSRKHLLTVCVNHTLRIWNIEKQEKASIVFSMDLLGQEREPQDHTRNIVDAGNPEILRVFQAEGAFEGDEFYAVTYSPHEGGQFKIWAIRDADQGSLGIRFLHPDNILRPPDPEPGPESKAIWKLADFRVSSGIWGRDMEFWVLLRSNKRYKIYSLKFDLVDLPVAWSRGWTSILPRASDKRSPPTVSPSDVQDVTELWLEYLFHPGGFSRAVLQTALSMYCLARKVKYSADATIPLEDQMCSAVATQVNSQQLKDEKEYGTQFLQYSEAMQQEWRLLHQEVQDLDKSSCQALTLAFGDHSDMPWLVFTGGCAAIRKCSQLESIVHNSPAVVRIATGYLEVPSIEDGSGHKRKTPYELAVLIRAAMGFREAFTPSFQRSCLTWLSNELWQEPLFSVSKRIEDYYERCGFAEEITDSAIASLRDALAPLGDFDGLTTDHFLAVIKDLPGLMTTESSDLTFSKFGLGVLVDGAREMIDIHARILFDLLVLITFIEIEVDEDISPVSRLNTSVVFMALLDQLRRYGLMQWLAKSTWTRMEADSRNLSLTVLETLFATDVRPHSTREQTQSVTLSVTIQDLLVWITGGNDPSITLDQVLVNIQCHLLKNNDLELASNFFTFQPSTSWATYIKGRFHLANGEPIEAALYFQKAARKMAGKPSPDYHRASDEFLSPTEAAHFGQGLPFYFTHIHQLFQSTSCPSHAAQFAQLALQFTPQSLSLERPTPLLTSLFNSSLQTSDIQSAFTALTRLPQRDQLILLPTIVKALLDLSDGPKQLLGLPWPSHIHPAIDAYLSNDQSSQKISSKRVTNPIERQRKILAAWRLKNGDFRGAAAALYPQLQTTKKQKHKFGAVSKFRAEGSGGDGVEGFEAKRTDESYLSVINLMACIGGENDSAGWMDGKSAKDGEAWLLSFNGDDGKRKVVTISDVRKGWQKELDRRSVIEGGRWGFGLVGGDKMELG
ncbi:MAG: hypothetical protein Q9170_005811 [Blastenia crenularia]